MIKPVDRLPPLDPAGCVCPSWSSWSRPAIGTSRWNGPATRRSPSAKASRPPWCRRLSKTSDRCYRRLRHGAVGGDERRPDAATAGLRASVADVELSPHPQPAPAPARQKTLSASYRATSRPSITGLRLIVDIIYIVITIREGQPRAPTHRLASASRPNKKSRPPSLAKSAASSSRSLRSCLSAPRASSRSTLASAP